MSLPQVGEQFEGRYRIDEVLGKGGFATVYAAFDLESSRDVALKVLRPDRADRYHDPTRARFDRELHIVANLQSAHTVVLYDGGETRDGTLYMVFERVPGEDLSALIARRGRLDPTVALHIVWQLLDSLEEAHQHGLLHRDVKPQNVRVFTYGDDPYRVKLLDFGLARQAEAGPASVTSTGELVGTPRYMAPEQLTEHPLSPATDLYSLGSVMLEMLFGKDVLYGQRWQEQLERLRSGHVFSMPEIDRVGADLIAVTQRMTARKPEDRYQSAAAVRAALQKLRPRATAANEPRPMQRRLAPAPLNKIAGVLAALFAVVVVWHQWPADSPPTTDPPPRRNPSSVGALIARPAADVGVEQRTDVSAPPEARSVDPPATPGRSVGCGLAARNEGLGYLKWRNGEEVYGFVPRDYDPQRAYPLVIALHQTASNPYRLLRLSRFAELAERDQVIVIAPRATGVLTWMGGKEEVGLVRRALLDATYELCVDTSRIFVAGHGKGGDLARHLACEPWVAAMATNSYRGTRGSSHCEPEGGVRHLMLSPLKSNREPVDGGRPCGVGAVVLDIELESLSEAEGDWKKRNGCGGRRTVSRSDKGTRCFTWACEPYFESCHVDGGHDWPDAVYRGFELEAQCDGKPPEFDTGAHIWEFLMASPPNERPGWDAF